MDECDTIKKVEDKFGDSTAAYLKNKHQGGKNNERGADYESNFAILQLSNLCYQVLTSGHDIHIKAQALAFVDDLIVTNLTSNSSYSYQIKNVKNITWHGGKHPLEYDFKCHYELDKEKGIEDSSTYLTVSNPELHDRLSKNIPDSIVNHTKCVLFEDEPLNISLTKESDLKQSLMDICSHNEPDKLTHLHTVIKGVWGNNKEHYTSVCDFVTEIRKNIPYHFLRSFTEDAVIDSDLVKIFDNIEGFSYQIFENQLNYSYSCVEKGVVFNGFFESEIDSSEFKSHAEVIIKENPSTFVELLGLKLL